MSQLGRQDDARRRWPMQALSLGWLRAPWLANSGLLADLPSTLPPGQSMYRISADVRVNALRADLQTAIKPGHVIATGEASKVVFVVDGHAMIMRANAPMVMKSSMQRAAALFIDALRILQGAVVSLSRNRQIQIVTPSATVGSRGTDFQFDAPSQPAYFCTCYGVTAIAANHDALHGETVTSMRHDRPLYMVNAGTPGRSIVAAPWLDPTGSAIDVDRPVDWPDHTVRFPQGTIPCAAP